MNAAAERPAPPTRAEVVAYLRELLDAEPPLPEEVSEAGRTANGTRLLKLAAERFPSAPFLLVQEAVRVIGSDEEAEIEDDEQEAAQLAAMVAICQRHGVPEDTPIEQGLAIAAERGDADAICFVTEMRRPEYRVHEALFRAALAAHPAWSQDGASFVCDGTMDSPETDTALVDWYQHTHPRDARAITAAVEASLPGRDPEARRAWGTAVRRHADDDDCADILLAWTIVGRIEDGGSDYLTATDNELAAETRLGSIAIDQAFAALECIGAIIRSPAGIHLAKRILEVPRAPA